MFVAYVVVGVLLALVLVASGRGKLVKDEKIVTGMRSIGVPDSWLPRLAALEFAGALGLLIGIFFRPLGIAAAIGVVLYFIGAVVTHIRGKDVKGVPTPTVLLLVGAAALVLGIASA
ncbi:DoxX family protein [Streptomyces sp. NPDC058001]|uniref:DoxX family protein n=1 Tax=Streptomyces sp. NPDC058001 TaxID=3346300 RepID=UPI0036EFAEC1